MAKKFMVNRTFKCSARLKYLVMAAGILMMASCANAQDHLLNETFLKAEKLAESSTVILNNTSKQLPIVALEKLKTGSIDLGVPYAGTFDSLLNKYQYIKSFNASTYLANGSLNPLLDDVKLCNTLIIQVTDKQLDDERVINFIVDAEKTNSVIVALFGANGPAKLSVIKSPIIWSPLLTIESAAVSAQAIFGGIAITNTLKAKYGAFSAGSGSKTEKIRLKYTVPEEVGIDSRDLLKIDEIAAEAINKRATPGAVVMVLKDGNVIFNKAYGSHLYDGKRPDKITDIFDLASVTKISATTQVVMQLVEAGKLSLDAPLSNYLARTRNTNRADIKVKEVMMHQAGFVSYIPFYQKLKPGDLSRDSSAVYSLKVADSCFVRKSFYNEVMWPQMLNAPLETRGKYVYSDLSMYYMMEVIEGITHEPLEKMVIDRFYTPLGMQTAGFNPRSRFTKDQIVPTEDDKYFRKTLVHGYVHDQGAALAGGVAGHAGLFASTNDVAILYQMMLNKGTYGGRTYYKPETVEQFTARQSTVSRRGYGFDRWDPDSTQHYPSKLASPQTYGHTGYTGIGVWVDPKYNLVYIFCSNRVNGEPVDPNKLAQFGIRPRIQDAIYEAVMKAERK